MKMSDGVEWGIHCAAVLARLDDGATLPGKALAEFHGVSESYLLKHLKSLTAAGILESVPGPHGGYRLGREPKKISLLDIVLGKAVLGQGCCIAEAELDDPLHAECDILCGRDIA